MFKVRSLVNAIYMRQRGRSFRDDESLSTLFGLLVTYGSMFLRASVMSLFTLGITRPHFRAQGVRIKGRSNLRLGRGSVLYRGALLDARGGSGIDIGDRVSVGEGSRLLVSGVVADPGVGIKLGRNSAVGMNCIIWGQGGVALGDDVLLGPNVMIFSENHEFGSVTTAIRYQGVRRAPVTIGDGSWLGAGSIVTMGVTIGSNSVVGAGSVVTRDVPSGAVVAGVPARMVRQR